VPAALLRGVSGPKWSMRMDFCAVRVTFHW